MATPTGAIWYPSIFTKDCILVANDQYKLKLQISSPKQCKTTLLGPAYGVPVSKMVFFPNADRPSFMAFASTEKILGISKVPFNGNPNKVVATLAHPGTISDLKISCDGNYLFTAGGSDMSVCMWKLDPKVIESKMVTNGKEIDDFVAHVEGGTQGPFWKEIKDFFHYAQIKA